ncbi:hypothetical protein Tco_0725448 [Tanacetum coccineum]|uniref:Uncharacterized protein n=1 Tax=Tanacetum coccineum TaxID=301880 RepID=A0ABQ4YFD6_9ASTR
MAKDRMSLSLNPPPRGLGGISKQGHWYSFEKRVGKGAGGQIFRETFSGLKGWKKIFFFLERRAIPDAMAWRHHDSDINDPVFEDGFSASDVQMDLPSLPKISLNIIPHLPFHRIKTFRQKTNHQKRVEVEDPKIVATRERKARAAAKKREKKRQVGDGGEGSRLVTERRKTIAHKDGSAASEATSSPEPIRTINPTNPSGDVAETAESREDRSPRVSPHGSANHSVHYYSDAPHDNEETDTLRLGTFGD